MVPGKDTEKLERDLESAIRQVFLKMEKNVLTIAAKYASTRYVIETVGVMKETLYSTRVFHCVNKQPGT